MAYVREGSRRLKLINRPNLFTISDTQRDWYKLKICLLEIVREKKILILFCKFILSSTYTYSLFVSFLNFYPFLELGGGEEFNEDTQESKLISPTGWIPQLEICIDATATLGVISFLTWLPRESPKNVEGPSDYLNESWSNFQHLIKRKRVLDLLSVGKGGLIKIIPHIGTSRWKDAGVRFEWVV